MNPQHLFVYGSLAKGRKNSHFLEKIGGYWTPAKISGVLKNEGWGAEIGYPGLVLDQEGQYISGFVFTSSKLGEHWKWLDDFEGAEYKRVKAEVFLHDGSAMNAFVYILDQ